MATLTTDYSSSLQYFTPFPSGTVGVREATYSLAAALALNDVIQMIPVGDGERVLDIQLIVETDLDTNGTPTIVLDVGDGDDPNRYIDGSTVAQAGGYDSYGTGIATAAAAAALNKVYTGADTIDVLVETGPATGATSGTIRLRAWIAS